MKQYGADVFILTKKDSKQELFTNKAKYCGVFDNIESEKQVYYIYLLCEVGMSFQQISQLVNPQESREESSNNSWEQIDSCAKYDNMTLDEKVFYEYCQRSNSNKGSYILQVLNYFVGGVEHKKLEHFLNLSGFVKSARYKSGEIDL